MNIAKRIEVLEAAASQQCAVSGNRVTLMLRAQAETFPPRPRSARSKEAMAILALLNQGEPTTTRIERRPTK
jgi:hypothetical protein